MVIFRISLFYWPSRVVSTSSFKLLIERLLQVILCHKCWGHRTRPNWQVTCKNKHIYSSPSVSGLAESWVLLARGSIWSFRPLNLDWLIELSIGDMNCIYAFMYLLIIWTPVHHIIKPNLDPENKTSHRKGDSRSSNSQTVFCWATLINADTRVSELQSRSTKNASDQRDHCCPGPIWPNLDIMN